MQSSRDDHYIYTLTCFVLSPVSTCIIIATGPADSYDTGRSLVVLRPTTLHLDQTVQWYRESTWIYRIASTDSKDAYRTLSAVTGERRRDDRWKKTAKRNYIRSNPSVAAPRNAIMTTRRSKRERERKKVRRSEIHGVPPTQKVQIKSRAISNEERQKSW